MSTREWISIWSSLTASNSEFFNCQKCLSSYRDRSDRDVMLEKLRSTKGCSFSHSAPQNARHKLTLMSGAEILFSDCIGNHVDLSVSNYVLMHQAYQKGVMPFSGSFSEQPNKIIEIFGVIDEYYYSMMLEEKRRNDSKPKPGRK